MKLILGTMTFSDQVDEAVAMDMIRLFSESGFTELDTAYQYNDGKTERLLGKLLSENPDLEFDIATKVNPWNDNGLKPEQVELQFKESLDRLQKGSVDLLYLHSPDLETPITKTLEKCWEFYQQGKFRRFGLSNFSSWQVAEVAEICRSRDWMMPTVYQGMYNALTRDVERELFPCLRNYGISFYAYNPLAGGLLTGKHQAYDQSPEPGRFTLNDQYATRYWKADYFNVLDSFSAACARYEIAPADAALRWLMHDSGLSANAGDGIILGASKLQHLKQNLGVTAGGQLPDDVVDVLNQGWEQVRPNCFKYFRP